MEINIKDDTIFTVIESEMAELNNDRELMLEIHEKFYQNMKPYIPKREGILEGHVSITPEYVHFLSEYAHYMYEGFVYGPNIPIFENGVIVGWWSPPDKEKKPTGKNIDYSTEKHQLATHHWDKAMIQDKGDEFKAQVGDIIINHLKNKGDNNG